MTDSAKEKFKDRLQKFQKALNSLRRALASPPADELDLAGIIQNFEFTYELSWKCLKAALALEGRMTTSPKSTFEGAYAESWISDEKTWVKMIEDRNNTVHSYDEAVAQAIYQNTRSLYLPLFEKLEEILRNRLP